MSINISQIVEHAYRTPALVSDRSINTDARVFHWIILRRVIKQNEDRDFNLLRSSRVLHGGTILRKLIRRWRHACRTYRCPEPVIGPYHRSLPVRVGSYRRDLVPQQESRRCRSSHDQYLPRRSLLTQNNTNHHRGNSSVNVVTFIDYYIYT